MGALTRWGFWGLGAVADAVADDLRLVGNATLAAVAARRADRAEAFARRHAVPRAHGSLEALLDDPQIDVVYVATPPERHATDCLLAVAAGKAVLCEKPFALSAIEGERVVDAARARGVFCMEAMWTRFVPAVVDAKAAVDRGELGRIGLVTGDFAYPAAASQPGREAPVDVLLDRGVYLVSLAQHLLGEPVDVRAMHSRGALDDQHACLLRYGSGALAAFTTSRRVRGRNELALHGDRASLVLRDPFYRAHRTTFEPTPAPVPVPAAVDDRGPPPRVAAWRRSAALGPWRRRLDPALRYLRGRRTRDRAFPGHGYQFELAEVARCLVEGQRESRVMPLADTLAVLRIVDSLRAAAGATSP